MYAPPEKVISDDDNHQFGRQVNSHLELIYAMMNDDDDGQCDGDDDDGLYDGDDGNDVDQVDWCDSEYDEHWGQ